LQETGTTLYKTVTALQFQDMATQLIAHTNKRLRGCVDQIARDALGADDPDGATVVDSDASQAQSGDPRRDGRRIRRVVLKLHFI
jgi:hypothetical protein